MLPTKPFGRTDHLSTRTVFGAAAFWELPQRVADETMELLVQRGVNHIDAAASYNQAEARLAPGLKRYPDHFFLATKTDARTAAAAREQLMRSLQRLGVERVDLWQFHNLVHDEDCKRALGAGGALEAALQARDEGLIRYIGITGHGLGAPRRHLRSLEQHDFDAVLLPYNFLLAAQPSYHADCAELFAECKRRNIAVQTMKALARCPWPGGNKTRNTWYQPFEQPADIQRAVHWLLAHEQLFLNTAADVELLPLLLDAAEGCQHRPPPIVTPQTITGLGCSNIFE